ncbi:MAG: nickel-dependent hydrogenase large subunit [Firmicutes bacterium]|nr:nickel-dependent hydrogenase large subunit [Bacillota bacterium]
MSKNLVIPIGPQHPSLKEPACFTITLEGEKVIEADIGIGYNHRGIEKSCESRNYYQALYIIERVCGICSHSHSTCYLSGVEKLAGVEIPRRAAFIRTIFGELERLHSHLLWLGVAGHEIGFDTLFMYTWRDRELVLDILAMLCGNRVNYGINTLGGVRRDLEPQHIDDIRRMCAKIEERNNYYVNLALSDATLAARLSGVGMLSKEDALKYGAVGPVLRASGVKSDTRRNDPYLIYPEIPFDVITYDSCDVFGRVVVRVLEINESIKIIRYCLDNMPDGDIIAKMPRKIPAGEVVSRYEAPRGEDVHFIKANGTDIPERVKVRAPSEANWHSMAHMLKGDYLADTPIIIAAIDPCYSCTDRAITLNNAAGSKRTDWEAIRKHGIEFYRNKGVDVSRILLPEKINY